MRKKVGTSTYIQRINTLERKLLKQVKELDDVMEKTYRDSIIGGESLSEAFRKQNLYSPMIIRMLDVGENTGQLEEQLSYISNYYYEKVDYISQNIAKMIEPLLISFVGIFMLIIIIGLMGPIYNLISVVGKS